MRDPDGVPGRRRSGLTAHKRGGDRDPVQPVLLRIAGHAAEYHVSPGGIGEGLHDHRVDPADGRLDLEHAVDDPAHVYNGHGVARLNRSACGSCHRGHKPTPAKRSDRCVRLLERIVVVSRRHRLIRERFFIIGDELVGRGEVLHSRLFIRHTAGGLV